MNNNGVNQSIFSDDDALFEPASWLIKIDFINQFILNNNVLISVLGESGSGKSSFAHLLQEKLDSEVQSVRLTATPLFDPAQFISQLCLLLDMQDKTSLYDIVDEVNARQSRVLAIIDNAEQLPESFIKEILDALQPQDGSGFFHVCLLSDFSLVKITSQLARDTYTDMIHSVELQPLNESETRAYIMTRMPSLTANEMDFSDDNFEEFFQLTEGNILGINTQMVGFFSKKTQQKNHRSSKFIPLAAIPVLGAAAVGVAYFMLSSPSVNVPQSTEVAQNNMESVLVELPLTSDIPYYQVASTQQLMENISLQKAGLQVALADQDDDGGSSAGDDNATDTDNDDNKDSSNDLSVSKADEPLVVMDKVVVIPKIEARNSEEVSSSPTVAEVAAPKTAQVKSTPPRKSAIKANIKTNIASGSYTIQLLASRDKRELYRVAKRYPATAGIKVQRFDNQGMTWYVLTKGVYAQKQQANHAIVSLPKELAQFKPWIRSTSNLKSVG